MIAADAAARRPPLVRARAPIDRAPCAGLVGRDGAAGGHADDHPPHELLRAARLPRPAGRIHGARRTQGRQRPAAQGPRPRRRGLGGGPAPSVPRRPGLPALPDGGDGGPWFALVAGAVTIGELGKVFSGAVNSTLRLIIGELRLQDPLRRGSGESNTAARALAIGSVIPLLIADPLRPQANLADADSSPLWRTLALTAVLYPVTLGMRLTQAGTETSQRASEFVFVGLAFFAGLVIGKAALAETLAEAQRRDPCAGGGGDRGVPGRVHHRRTAGDQAARAVPGRRRGPLDQPAGPRCRRFAANTSRPTVGSSSTGERHADGGLRPPRLRSSAQSTAFASRGSSSAGRFDQRRPGGDQRRRDRLHRRRPPLRRE